MRKTRARLKTRQQTHRSAMTRLAALCEARDAPQYATLIHDGHRVYNLAGEVLGEIRADAGTRYPLDRWIITRDFGWEEVTMHSNRELRGAIWPRCFQGLDSLCGL